MRKIYLQKVTQYNRECYIGKIDPRELIKVAKKIEMDQPQESQRPLSSKKVKDIANFIVDKEKGGLLPNTLTLATVDSSFEVKSLEPVEDLYYIDFPETPGEFEKFQEKIEVQDGQHRLYSFMPETTHINDNDSFEIGFLLYIKPSLTDKRRIFVACNEKQQPPTANFLIYMKGQLSMLDERQIREMNLMSSLNETYPLKGRIIMGAEKISGGFKAQQVIDIFRKAHLDELCKGKDIRLNNEELVEVISRYLSAWESICGFKYQSSKAADAGPAIKISGLRYMLFLLPAIWKHMMSNKKPFKENEIKDVLRDLIDTYHVAPETFFTMKEHKSWFADRTATSEAVRMAENALQTLGNGEFNPLA